MEGGNEFSGKDEALPLQNSEVVENKSQPDTDTGEGPQHTERSNELIFCETRTKTEDFKENNLITPVSVTEKQRIIDEHEILETTVTRNSVMYITRKHLKIRKIHINLKFRESLCIASKSIDSRNMINHLQRIVDKTGSQPATDSNLSDAKLAEFRQSLEDAVSAYDIEEINGIHGMLEAILLRHDHQYLERVEAKKFQFKKAVRENKAPCPPPTWWQSPTYRLLCLVQGDKTGESANINVEDQRWFASRAAWAVAITLLFIAITFVSVDFYRSKTNPAVSTKMIQEERLELPTVYACLTTPQIPTFVDIDRRAYSGPMLWGLRSYTNHEIGESFMYPQTHKLISEPSYIGPDDFCNQTMSYLSKKRIDLAMDPNGSTPRCYSCLQIGPKSPVWVEHSKAMGRTPGAVTLEFATSKEIDYCYTRRAVWNSFLRDTIKKRLKEQATKLEELGVIVMENPSNVEFALDFGFEAFERLRDEERLIEAQADIMCNLYLFSGVFYPVEPNTEVHYSFNVSNGLNAWKMLDDKSRYLKVKPAVVAGLSKKTVNRTTFLDEIHVNFDITETVITPLSINMYSVDNASNKLSFNDFSTQLRENHHDMLLFTKKVEQDTTQYIATPQSGSQKLFMTLSPYRRYNISLDFASFDVEVNVKVPTTTMAEFLTDIFEYIGLFTGVCAYSLLVSPARMYLRRVQKRQS